MDADVILQRRDDVNNYSVYVHIFPNGKRYYGITSHNDVNRRFQNGFGYRNQKLIWNAICKYGWDNIEHIILHSGVSKETACELEIQYIKSYNTTDPRFGYNIENGGSAPGKFTDEMRHKASCAMQGNKHPMFGKHISDEHKNKISKALKGRKLSELTKQRISTAKKGKPGRVQSQETKDKIRLALLGRKMAQSVVDKLVERNKENPCGFCKPRKVVCVDTGEIFDSLTQAGESIGVSKTSIYKACKGERKTVHKLRFAYVD